MRSLIIFCSRKSIFSKLFLLLVVVTKSMGFLIWDLMLFLMATGSAPRVR